MRCQPFCADDGVNLERCSSCMRSWISGSAVQGVEVCATVETSQKSLESALQSVESGNRTKTFLTSLQAF